ncbi:MAG TPA: hypothetical protein VGK99_12200 [Acidobacteriota bacterium]|jgi:hypothetical protein
MSTFLGVLNPYGRLLVRELLLRERFCERREKTMFYDALGILFLVLIGAFFLFLPLATSGLLVWGFDRVRTVVDSHRRGLTTPANTQS